MFYYFYKDGGTISWMEGCSFLWITFFDDFFCQSVLYEGAGILTVG